MTIGVGCDPFTDVVCVSTVLSLDVGKELSKFSLYVVPFEGNFLWVALPLTAGRVSGLIWFLLNLVVFLER